MLCTPKDKLLVREQFRNAVNSIKEKDFLNDSSVCDDLPDNMNLIYMQYKQHWHWTKHIPALFMGDIFEGKTKYSYMARFNPKKPDAKLVIHSVRDIKKLQNFFSVIYYNVETSNSGSPAKVGSLPLSIEQHKEKFRLHDMWCMAIKRKITKHMLSDIDYPDIKLSHDSIFLPQCGVEIHAQKYDNEILKNETFTVQIIPSIFQNHLFRLTPLICNKSLIDMIAQWFEINKQGQRFWGTLFGYQIFKELNNQCNDVIDVATVALMTWPDVLTKDIEHQKILHQRRKPDAS